MKNKLLFLLLLISSSVFCQDILWEKSLGGKHADYLMDAIATPDYGFILAGSSLSDKTGNKTQGANGNFDYWIWKMKENGDLDWQKSFGGSGNDFLQSIRLTPDGGFILAGVSSSPSLSEGGEQRSDKKDKCRGGDDFWIIKLDAAGNEEWQKTIGGISQEKLKSICPTKDGGYILGGSSSSPNTLKVGEFDTEELKTCGEKKSESYGNMDYWIVKLNNKGEIVWQKSYGGIYEDELRSIEATNDGGYIVGGYSNSPSSSAMLGMTIGNKTDDNKGIGDYWILKLDKEGSITWQKTIGGDEDDQLYVVHQTYDGDYVVGGNSNSSSSYQKRNDNSNGTDFWVLKLGQEGEILWQETYDIAEIDILSSLVENKDHTLLIGGFAKVLGNSKKTDKGTGDYVALKVTEKGEELWRQSVGSNGEDLLKKVIETRDGGYLLAGTSSPQLPPLEGESATDGGSDFRQKANLKGIQQTQNQQLQNTTNEVNKAIGDTQNDINKGISDKMSNATNKVNDVISSPNPSEGGEPATGALKYGLNSPTGGFKLPSLSSPDPSKGGETGASALNGLGNSTNEKQGQKGTGDQKTVFGSNDFWVVKLRDKDKKEEVKVTIEALPNPATSFTNVIVGYEYESGTATLVDMSGHILYQTSITSRTVPINLSPYPEGIYIVNIKTNVSSDGVKLIKKGSGN